EAPSYDQTDWPQILTLYGKLLKVWPSPVVALNRAVPLAMISMIWCRGLSPPADRFGHHRPDLLPPSTAAGDHVSRTGRSDRHRGPDRS
ncbi:MAG TPA: hypothetical protein VIV12_00650, partial [Streptosporangiaceae bacterium]